MEIIFPSLFFFHLRKKRMEKVDKPFNNGKQVKRRKCQKIKMFRDRVTLVDLTDTEIKDRYRLNTVEILSLYDVLKVNLCKPTKRSHAIPGLVRLLLALNFFAKGDFQSCIAVIGGVSQSSCSRSLDEVLKAIMLVYKSYVYFPSDSSYLNTVKGKFYEIGGFPNIVGIIDCTHITLCPPADLEHIYRNRKSSHSINVQLVCSFNLKFVDIVAKFPGSSHDSYILSNSSLSERFQQGEFKDSWLLGDCGYPLKTWLMTPVWRPKNAKEKNYNRVHATTRCIIERAFGILKSKFRCLDITGGSLLYSPEKVCYIVVACVVLHNIIIQRVQNDVCEIQPACEENTDLQMHVDQNEAIITRNDLIQRFF